MTFFLLVKINNYNNSNINKYIINPDIYRINHDVNSNIDLLSNNKSLKIYMDNIKKKINNSIVEWDIYKKHTNPYEYIHTIISNTTKISVSKIKPLSRSFYKMIEICNIFNILDEYTKPINSFHLAEGPGGFIEAFVFLRKNSEDKYYGMTLISDNINIPSWKKSKLFLQKNKNIIIETGVTKTGDLMKKENLLYCLEKYNNSMDIVTGDGGFDFSIDFNQQEQICTNLIFAQICFALAIQKIGGTFILKIFDIFTEASLDLMYILSSAYSKVNIIKPNTSRIANSEKYIICRDFKLKDSKAFVLELSKIYDILDIYINRFLTIDIPYYYKNKLEEINAIFGQQQIENINTTFNLIEQNTLENNKDKIELYKKNNINKCIHWCQKYNIPYNKSILTSNLFINSEDKDPIDSINIENMDTTNNIGPIE